MMLQSQNGSTLDCAFEKASIPDDTPCLRYRYLSTIWINKSQLLDAYHHSGFQGFSSKRYEFDEMEYLVDAVILPSLGLFGILGNILGIHCFSKKLYLTYYSLLFSLAITDLLTILSFISYYSFPHWIDHSTLLEQPVCAYIIIVAYSILHLSQLLDIYLLVALSIERYFAICRPMVFRTRKMKTNYYIIPIFTFSLIYSSPIFFEYSVKTFEVEKCDGGFSECCHFVENTTLYLVKQTDFKLNNQEYKIVYEIILKLLVKSVLPYALLITTNLLIIRAFCNLKYRPMKQGDTDLRNDMNNKKGSLESQRHKESFEFQTGNLSDMKQSCSKDMENENIDDMSLDVINLDELRKSDSLRLHTGPRGLVLRQSQINLGFLNLAITIVFLMCYSIIWLWAIPDFISLLKSSSSKVCKYFQQ